MPRDALPDALKMMDRSKTALLHDLAGAALVLLARVLTAPKTLWEYDEVLFAQAVQSFEPARNHPHPPGYPLYVGIGKAVALVTGDPFSALVFLSIAASVIGFIALRRACLYYLGEESLATSAALLFHFSAAMLVHGPLPMSDPVALMFVCLTLHAATVLERAPTRGWAILLGLFSSAAIGCRPQFALFLVPALLIVIWRLRDRGEQIAAVSSFALVSFLWVEPLAGALGGVSELISWERRQAAYVAAHDAGQSRGALSAAGLVARFVFHPWGPKFIALPVLLLAAAGAVSMWRRGEARRAIPLWIVSGLQLLFALLVMDPADAARYSLPSLLAVALLAGAGLRVLRTTASFPAAPAVIVFLIAAASIVYTSPILRPRHATPSPPAAAAGWAREHWQPQTVLLSDLSLRPHAEFFFAGKPLMPIESGLRTYADRPDIPLVIYGDGGATGDSTKVFQWPENDAYGKLTRNHYRVVSLEEIPPVRRFVPLSGVFPLERGARGDTWRWLAPLAVLRFPALGKRTLALTMQLSIDCPFDQNPVSILVDGREVSKAVVTKLAAQTSTLPFPAAGGTVTIRSARSFMPSEVVHNGDNRRIAVELVGAEQQ